MSGGLAVAVSDDEIVTAAQVMAREEGQAAEPAGTVAVAGRRALASSGHIDHDETVACLVTGHALKDPHAFADRLQLDPPAVIAPSLDALRDALHRTRGARR